MGMKRPEVGLDGLAVGTAVFLSGAVLLGVEIAASRVLAPTFGSSLYVWGALIGVVLTGLAVGCLTAAIVAGLVCSGSVCLAAVGFSATGELVRGRAAGVSSRRGKAGAAAVVFASGVSAACRLGVLTVA